MPALELELDDDVGGMLLRDESCDALMRCVGGSRDRRWSSLLLMTVAKQVRFGCCYELILSVQTS